MQNGLPVDFTVNVNGKQMGASLLSIEDCGIHNAYRIRFEDGYEDSFRHAADVDNLASTDENNQPADPKSHHADARALDMERPWCEKEEEGIHYCVALYYQLGIFYHIRDGITIIPFRYQLDNTQANAWLLRKKNGDSFYYSVYLQTEHFFDLFKIDKGWATLVGEELWPEGTGHPLEAAAIGAIPKENGIPPIKPAATKTIEFPLLFDYKGKQMIAQGMLTQDEPTPECMVICAPEDNPNHTVAFRFLKVGRNGKIFEAAPGRTRFEKLEKAIGKALEKMFSARTFSTN